MFGAAREVEVPTRSTRMKIERSKLSKRRRSSSSSISRPGRAKRVVSINFDDYWKDLSSDELAKKMTEQSSFSSDNQTSASNTSANEPPESECSVGRALVERGKARANAGNWEQAIELYNRALSVQKAELGENHASVARTLTEKGTAAAAQGLVYSSILDLERALLIQRRASVNEKSSLEVADMYLRVGQMQHRHGNFVEATNSFRSALEIRRRVHGDKDIRVARIVCIIALAHHQRRRYKEAIDYYSEGLETFQALGFTKKDPEVAWLLHCISDQNMYFDRVRDFWSDSNAI